ncbi:MAG: iron-containing alcohol dehydrogenase [Anaerotruncus sp.]|nr:iron-containing alcohol dehydrogenase [Anaerotruncus sp.]
MTNFSYCVPTKIVFGKGVEEQAGQEILACGGKKVLLHYGGGSAERSGLLGRIERSLEAAGLPYVRLGGVVPNPRLSLVREGIALCKQENVDFILAVGGGSVIDSAKAIGYGIVHDFDVWDIFSKKRAPTGCAPIGAVLTLSATGSETSASTVITNEDGWLKRSGNSEYIRPRFALMNPELTYTLPPYQTASGGVDIMMHTMERYFTAPADAELTDRMCEALLKTVIHNLPIALANPEDYNARAELMWAGSLSHCDLLNAGRDRGDWSCHQMEHELGGMFDVAHGAGLSAIWGSWARYVYQHNIGRFAQFAVNVMDCTLDFAHPERTALEGICAIETFFHSVNMPTNIKELGFTLTDAQITELAHKCAFDGTRTIGSFQTLNEQDMAAIFTAAR